MGADKLYVTIEPAAGTTPATLLEAVPVGDFFKWTRIEGERVHLCRHSQDREIVERMLRSAGRRVRRAAMIEVADTAMIGTGYLYERVGDEIVLVDETTGGEAYGDDVANFFDWRFDFHALA